MNTTQKLILAAFMLALVLAAIRPPWQQTYRGVKLSYAGDLGQHFLWQRPAATGEKSWMRVVPASECEVLVDKHQLSWQCGVLFMTSALLLFVVRTRSRTLDTKENGAATGASDWKYAAVAALVLICAAAFVIFVIHPFGFEEQIGAFFILFPGMFVYASIESDFDKMVPALLHKSLLPFVIYGVSLLWYFAICDGAIVIYRLARSHFKNRREPLS
jgi:hypothetical protein